MPKKFWEIVNQAGTETAEIRLYGEIASESWYEDDVTPKMFADELAACEGKPINVHINSLGGDVFAAQLIYTAIKNYPGTVNVYIDGICASAATIVASAGDRVFMPVNAIYMIHNPATFAWGDAKELRKMADTLDTVKQTIVNVYTARSRNLSEKQVRNLMDAETWMAADEALDKGFVDEVVGRATVEDDGDAIIVNSVKFDISRCKDKARMREILASGKEQTEESNEVISVDDKTFLQKLVDLLGGVASQQEPQDNAPDPVQQERSRVAALAAMKTGNKYADSILDTAIKNGQTAEEIKPFIDAMPKAEDENVLQAIRDLVTDQLQSGADNVQASAGQQPAADDEAARKKAAIEDIVKYANQMGGAGK